MSDYLGYEPEDFAADDFFIHWVKSTDINAETFWQNWLETYPFKRAEVEAARQLVLLTQNLPEPEISDAELGSLKESIFDKIAEEGPAPRKLWSYIPVWAAAAAVSGLLLLAGWMLLRPHHLENERYPRLVERAAEKYDLIEVKNLNRPVRLVNLPDGSSVVLKKGSMLSYPNQFDKDARVVYLTGEGFFEVAKNPEKPFYVHANQIITKVLGTSFTVRAFPDQDRILVAVKTGRVSVYKATGDEAKAEYADRSLKGMVLNPNQQALYADDQIVLMENQPELPHEAAAPEMTFEYEEKPLREIFSELEKTYGITIVYDQTVMGNCPVTASLTGEPLNEKLKLLCRAVRAHYENVNGEIVVTGQGCD